MSLRNFISENVFLPISDLVNGQSVRKYFLFLEGTKNWSREQIDEFQNNRLRLLVQHSVANVPYYRDLFHEMGLSPDDIQTKQDLRKIPIVDKSVMRKEGIERFTAEGFPKKQMRFDRSSGSTGEPFNSYTTQDAYSFNVAAKLQTWYGTGYRLGDKYVKLSQRLRKSKVKKVQDWINGCLYIPVEDANDEMLLDALSKIEKFKPTIIRGYPSTILFLAQYKNTHPRFKHCPDWIMTTGEKVTTPMRNTIEEAFRCKMLDSYSCEGNSNVAECIGNNCYHVTEEYGITEVLDDDGNPIENGVGHVITTDLWNFAHPFIRYNTQDLVEVSSQKCRCGNNHMRINSIVGRDSENIIATNGCRFTTQTFSIFFTDSNSELGTAVDGYQLVKKKDGSVLFKLVANEFYNKEKEQYIIDYWSEKFGKKVIVEIVDKIPITSTNKWLSIVEE